MTAKPTTTVTTEPTAAAAAAEELFDPQVLAPLARITRDQDEEERQSKRIDDAERSYIEKLSDMEDAMRIFQRRAELLENCRLVAIRATNPVDWILGKNDKGEEIAMPGDSACSKIADIYGIDVSDIMPRDSRGVFTPEITTDEKGRTTYRAWASGMSRTTGRKVALIECARRDDERFIGRDDNPNDLRSAVLTLARSKITRILSGLAKVPRTVLEASWSGTGKSTEHCTFGHGYGSADSRRAQAVTSDDVKAMVVDFGKELMARVGGDKEAGRDLLVEITKSPDGKFKGFDTIQKMTKDWQIKNAMERLRAHSVFGDEAIGIPKGGSAVPQAPAPAEK